MTAARQARLLLLSLAGQLNPCYGPKPDPATAANIRTSLADARTALCVATGNDLDLIDPATGLLRLCSVQWCDCGVTTRQRCQGARVDRLPDPPGQCPWM